MKKIFVTGESGTIPLAISSLAKRFEIKVVNSQLEDNYNLKQFKKHQSFKIREPEIDILDRDLLFYDLENIWKDVDTIVHSAAFVGTDFCDSSPFQAIDVNVTGTYNIVEICKAFNIKLIYFSTTAILDPNEYSREYPISEKTPINPRTLYGITKYTGEMIVRNLMKDCKPPIIVRPVFGFSDYPHDLHSALTKLIYTLYSTVVKKEPNVLKILLNKKIRKSYTRVENIAKVVLQLVNSNTWEKEQIYNVGSNYKDAKDWYELYDIIRDCFKDCFVELNTNLEYYDNIKFVPELDYLHYHNMIDARLENEGLDFDSFNCISLREGIFQTVKSVIENFETKPYWINT